MPACAHTTEEVTRALLCLAEEGGNSNRAAAKLKAQGLQIPARTLRNWRENTFPDRYKELHETHSREIEATLVTGLRELAIAGQQASLEAVQVARAKLHESKDPAGAARNLMVTGATAMDKLYLATDRPTHITQDRNAGQILTALAAKLGLTPAEPAINGTAEDITDGPLLPVSAAVNAPAPS